MDIKPTGVGVAKPFRRTCRQFVDGHYARNAGYRYIEHPKYAQEPEHYIRALSVIQKDLITLFDFIEPSDRNLDCYSFRVHELLMRACMEIEANCKAILIENGYTKCGDLRMDDYNKIENSHRLSAYQVKLPVWKGVGKIRTPFLPWKSGGSLKWYQDYNASKHDRHQEFVRASFGSVVDAVSGLVVILSAQFYNRDFSGDDVLTGSYSWSDVFDTAVGGYFRVRFPDDWPQAERYDFNWQDLEKHPDPFQSFPFPPP